MSFQAPASLAGLIADHIEKEITMGLVQPGERLQEMRIASELNVSRGSVREALLILERRHLIDILPRKGAVVSVMTEKHVRSVYEVYVIMLSVLARKACTHSHADLVPLAERIQAMQAHADAGQVVEFYESTFAFARAAYVFADNPVIVDILEDLQPSVRRCYFMALRADKAELPGAMRSLRALMNAVLQRRPDQAAKTIEAFGEHQSAWS